jgi:hypothetical protein
MHIIDIILNIYYEKFRLKLIEDNLSENNCIFFVNIFIFMQVIVY